MIFEVTPDQIACLNDTDLRTLVANLCTREISNAGFSTACVTWGGHQNAPDGGIDARVDLNLGSDITGYVPRPNTGIQVKATDMPRAAILKEMKPDGNLLDSIKELGRQNGAYIIVSSHGSYSNTALTNRRNAMVEALAGEPEVENLKTDFYDQQRLTTWVNQHPGVITWVLQRTGQALSGWRPFGDWSSSPTSVEAEYFADDKVRLLRARVSDDNNLGTTDGINTLRTILSEPKGIIRLVGLSGVGKTRLAQALFDERVGKAALDHTLAIYTDISDAPDPVPMDLLSRLIKNNQQAIVIVDNCGIDLHKKLSACINQAQCQINLLTIEYDIKDDQPENTDVFKLEAVSEDLIEKILESRFPTLSPPERSKIAEFSTGNVRIAFALANTAKNGESLANLKDSELFTRLFHQNNTIDQNLLDAAKAYSLVYSYDGETLEGDEAELPILAVLAGQTPNELYRHSSELSRRQLVQKRNKWRAVLPHALAHHLAKLALEDIPFEMIRTHIIKGSSARLLLSFSRRIGFLHDTEQAKIVASNWLQKDGLLGNVGSLTPLGKALLNNIAPIDPELTLSFLENAAKYDDTFFSDANSNRRVITGILRSLAYESELFTRCIALLVKFAAQEKEGNNTHDARQILPSLFHIYLSGSHASAKQRTQAIRQLLDSRQAVQQKLGISVLEGMLKTNHFSSSFGFEFGARARNYGYYPSDHKEVAEWYITALNVVAEYGVQDHPQALKIKETFANKIRWLIWSALLIDKTISVADTLAKKSGWPLGWVGVRHAIKQSPKDMPPDELQKLKALAKRLEPSNLQDMVRSYALTKEWSALDIADLEDDEQEQPLKAREKISNICLDLGRQLSQSSNDLNAMLPEIVASDSYKNWSVGKGLAEGCGSLEEMWEKITVATFPNDQEAKNTRLLAGFIAASSNIAPGNTDAFLEIAFNDTRFHESLVDLQINAGMTESGIKRLHRAVETDTVPAHTFRSLALGGISKEIPDDELGHLLDKLSNRDGALGNAIDVFGMRLHGISPDSEEANDTLKAIGKMLLSKLTYNDRTQHEDYELGIIVRLCLADLSSEPIARTICEKLWVAVYNGEMDVWNNQYLISALTQTHPKTVLDIFVGQQDDRYMRRRNFFSDLRDSSSDEPLANVSEQIMMEWVELDPAERFCKLAQVVRYFPKQTDKNTECKWTPIAKKLITLAPESLAVLDIFYDRFSPMSWSGPRSAILAQRVPLLRQLLDNENPEIVTWARDKLPEFEKIIADEREYEAEHDRNRDEKFEW